MTEDHALRRAVLLCDSKGAGGFAAALIDRCVREALAPVTGALVQTPVYVVAVVEADDLVLQALCELIKHDWPTCRRFDDHLVAGRGFEGWTKRTVCDEPFVDQLIDALLANPEVGVTRRVEQLALELAKVSGLVGSSPVRQRLRPSRSASN